MTKIITRSYNPLFSRGAFPHFLNALALEANPESAYVPRVNLSEDSANFYIHAELPGLAKEDVKLTLTDGILTLSGEKKQFTNESEHNYFRIEQKYGKFSRRFSIPENTNDEAMKATFENGILAITLPKKEMEKPKEREIPIGFSLN